MSQSVSSFMVAAPSFSIDVAPVPTVRSVCEVFWSQVDEQVGDPAVAGCGYGAFTSRHQVQRVLRVGEDPHRPRPAHVEAVGVTELA